MPVAWILLGLSLAAGSLYLVLAERGPYRGRVAIKGLAVGVLTVLAAVWLIEAKPVPAVAWFLVLGLGLSSVGDVLLGLGSERSFLRGLVAFLLGHVAYVVLFLSFATDLAVTDLAYCVLLAVIAVIYFLWLRPHLDDMRIPVLCYLAVILAMGCAALLGDFTHWWVPAGALLFVFSDAILAADRFVRPFRGAGYLVWMSYYVGQLAIAVGAVQALAPGSA